MFKGFERLLKDTAQRNYRCSEKKDKKQKRNLNLSFRTVCEKKEKNRGITTKSLWHYSITAACRCCIILVKYSRKNEILNKELRTLELCVTQPQT